MVSGECPSNNVTNYQFNTHYDCVVAGYKEAYNAFKSLEDMEELEKNYIEQEKLVIKFECKALNVENT
tara:strand:+ start:406 stop:609 length:204 start_codon:yes stop_codon:yes gene_type:complete